MITLDLPILLYPDFRGGFYGKADILVLLITVFDFRSLLGNLSGNYEYILLETLLFG